MEREEGFLHHEPCPKCGSKDNLARYKDGHAHCFSDGCEYHEPPTDQSEVDQAEPRKSHKKFLNGGYQGLKKRKITEETCRKWRYQIGRMGGKPVQIANYIEDGQVVGQKIRFPNKDFLFLCPGDTPGLWGKHLWKDGGKMVVITEGEIDCMTVSQLQGNKWPVVSIPNGVRGAKQAVQKDLDWLEKFEAVIIMFDQDEPGRKATTEIADLFTPGKVKVANLPLKDPNEMLKAGRGPEVIKAIWDSQEYRPDGIIAGKDTWRIVQDTPKVVSTMYPWKAMNEMTYGFRAGELVILTAGTGIGKSTVCREISHYLINEKRVKVGYIALEESIYRTTLGLMSIEANVPLHIKGDLISDAERRQAWERVMNNDRVYLYDHWGSLGSENLMARLKYMALGCGCRWIFLDHISIVVSGINPRMAADERRLIDNTMTQLRSLVEQTKIGLFLVSHLKRPEKGKGYEEGRAISLSDLRGSGALEQLSDMVVGFERNQQGPNPNVVRIRVLKNRFSGDTGISGFLEYSKETGRMSETTECPFEDESQDRERKRKDRVLGPRDY